MNKKETIKLHPTLENQSKYITNLSTKCHSNNNIDIALKLNHISDQLTDIVQEESNSNE